MVKNIIIYFFFGALIIAVMLFLGGVTQVTLENNILVFFRQVALRFQDLNFELPKISQPIPYIDNGNPVDFYLTWGILNAVIFLINLLSPVLNFIVLMINFILNVLKGIYCIIEVAVTYTSWIISFQV